MEIFLTIVRTSPDNRHYLIDTIIEDGKTWLVPQWVEKGLMPLRMVCIDEYRPRKFPVSPDGKQRAHYEIADHPLPVALLDGSELGELAYEYEVRQGEEV